MRYMECKNIMPAFRTRFLILFLVVTSSLAFGQYRPVVPANLRGNQNYVREGTHDANNIRTVYYNYGMVGDYPLDPIHVDPCSFHSFEVPKGSGVNYSDGDTPYVLAQVTQTDATPTWMMLTGYRERQATEPFGRWPQRLNPRPGYFQTDLTINRANSPAISNDPRTWPDSWPDKLIDPNDPGWSGSWDGYFGKRPAADQESYFVVDDNYYTGNNFYPDSRDQTRRGLGLSMEIRGFQWSNPQAGNVLFHHYDVINESTMDYLDNIIFGIYDDSGVGGESLSCDGVYESDDDNAFFDRSFGLNLTYTWDTYGHGVSCTSNCAPTGYLGYAYLETPGNPYDGIDNDQDGITDERRDSGPGTLIQGRANILAYVLAHYDTTLFTHYYGPLSDRPTLKKEYWWTGDENMNWDPEFDDVGADGVPNTHDLGEGDGIPTSGEPNFDKTDVDESDMIGLTGFKMNRIAAGKGASSTLVDNVIFYDDGVTHWPKKLYTMFTDPTLSNRFDQPVVNNYNIAFLFASGTFKLPAGAQERFSMAVAYAPDLADLRLTTRIVQRIYAASYQFTVPPKVPIVSAEARDKAVALTWSDISERSANPITRKLDFEGYKIYRSTDIEFQDARTITNGQGSQFMSFGRPIAQFDLVNEYQGYSTITVDGVGYYLGNNSGLVHAYVDTPVVNGQTYYYAVCAYSHGDLELEYYPSENPITISRTLRGGIVYPTNAVQVVPNPRALGYQAASTGGVTRVAGNGFGTVRVQVVNSNDVPQGRTRNITTKTFAPIYVHADYYQMVDSASGKVYIEQGTDFGGTDSGAVGAGIVPHVWTIPSPQIDTSTSGFLPGSLTNAHVNLSYYGTMSNNIRRPGYPNDIEIDFSDTVVDTSLPQGFILPPKPLKFQVFALTPAGSMRLKSFYLDATDSKDSTLSSPTDVLFIATYDTVSQTFQQTWQVKLDTSVSSGHTVFPKQGDKYRMHLLLPFEDGDSFSFQTTAQRINVDVAKASGAFDPYVVPNPYAGGTKLEPARFGVSGRGERRLEFRGLPSSCSIRIYTIRGELVQTLYHDNSLDGYAVWDLRTKDNLDVAPGLYIFHVDAGTLGTKTGKFAIIK